MLQATSLCPYRAEENGQSGQFCTPSNDDQDASQKINFPDAILNKRLLCSHDIDLINKQISQISGKDGEKIIDKIAEKTQKKSSTSLTLNKAFSNITNSNTTSVSSDEEITNNLISLFNLTKIKPDDMSFRKRFSKSLAECLQKNPHILKSVVKLLPICESEVQFLEDCKIFVGANPDSKIEKILKPKKEILHQATQKKLGELKQKRGYPVYLDELFKAGYIYLTDHLIHMNSIETLNERIDAIKKMTFSCLSKIVVETKSAIIEKVKQALPANSKNVLFLIGGTGSGKSTTLCFLRGDRMKMDDDRRYESDNDPDKIIGHDLATSCTFLPTVKKAQDWVIVDFPGFNDSKGPLVSLGMECALKALVKEYHAKVMVIEPIVNNQNRYKAVSTLCARLQRLLDNYEECLVGITKYSQDSDYMEIQSIEEQQKKKLSEPTKDERALLAEMQQLCEGINELKKELKSDNSEDIMVFIEEQESELKDKQKQLDIIQEEKKERLREPLPPTDEKAERLESIATKEKELLNQLRLKNSISFKNLENCDASSFFKKISEQKAVSVNPQNSLDALHMEIIKFLFENDLKIKMETVPYYLRSIEDFERNVNEKSLINTVFSWAYPEVGEFLHLPEIDRSIVRNFDREIVDSCITKYIDSLILKIDIPSKEMWEKELQGKFSQTDLDRLKKEYNRLQAYVLSILGVKLTENTKEIEEKWNEIKKKVKTTVSSKQDEYDLDVWVKVVMGIPLGIPLAIYYWWCSTIMKSTERKAIKETIDQACQSLKTMRNTLKKLKEVELLIKGKENVIMKDIESVIK